MAATVAYRFCSGYSRHVAHTCKAYWALTPQLRSDSFSTTLICFTGLSGFAFDMGTGLKRFIAAATTM